MVVGAAVVTLKSTTLQPTVTVATVKVLAVAELVCLTVIVSLLTTTPGALVYAPPLMLYSPPVILIGVGISIADIIIAFEINTVLKAAPVTAPKIKSLGQVSPAVIVIHTFLVIVPPPTIKEKLNESAPVSPVFGV